MNLLLLLLFSILAKAASVPVESNREKSEHSLSGSKNDEALSQLQSLIRRESPKAALYSDEEIKEYLGHVGDSDPHISNSMLRSHQRHRHGNLARETTPKSGSSGARVNDSASGAEEGARKRHDHVLEPPASDSAQGQNSSVQDTETTTLAGQRQTSEEKSDAQLSKPGDVTSNDDKSNLQLPKPGDTTKDNKITISIDAVRIPKENGRQGLSSHVNDQYDNSVAYPRQFVNQRYNRYFRSRTSQSSPSAEALAMLTQKLSKMEVEIGRLKEAVLLQGAVHIKTSERIEEMLLVQGKLAVKNGQDTLKVLKRIRRCCPCSGGGKAQRTLRKNRKGRGRQKPNEESTTTKTPDSKQIMHSGSSDKNNNLHAHGKHDKNKNKGDSSGRQNQADSHSHKKTDVLQDQSGNTDDGSSSEVIDNFTGESNQSNKSASVSPNPNSTPGNNASLVNEGGLSPQQSTGRNGLDPGVELDANAPSSGLTTQATGTLGAGAAQQHGDQKDKHGQTPTPSQSLSFTTVPKPPNTTLSTSEAADAHDAETTSPSEATSTRSTQPSMEEQSFTVAGDNIHGNVSRMQTNSDNIVINSTNKSIQGSETPAVPNKHIHGSERSTLSSVKDRTENHHTQISVTRDPTEPSHTDAVKLKGGVGVTEVKNTTEMGKQGTEPFPKPENDGALDPALTTARHMSATDKTTTRVSTLRIDSLSEDEHDDRHIINNYGAKNSSQASASDSDKFRNISFSPSDGNIQYNHAHYLANTTTSSKATTETSTEQNPAHIKGSSSEVWQNATHDENNLNTDDSYDNDNDGDKMSTKSTDGNYSASTLSAASVGVKGESQTKEKSVNGIPPGSEQQSTHTPLNVNQKSTRASVNTEDQSSDATPMPSKESSVSPSLSGNQTVDSTSGNSSYTLTTMEHSSVATESTAPITERVSDADRSTAVDRAHLSASSTTTTATVTSTTSSASTTLSTPTTTTTPPLTTTASETSITSSTALLTPTTTTSKSTVAHLTPSSTSTVSSNRIPTKETTRTSPTTSAEVPDTSATTKLPSTRRVGRKTTTEMMAETSTVTAIPTTTEEVIRELAVDLTTGEITKDDLPGVSWVVPPTSTPTRRGGSYSRWKRSETAVSASRGGQCVIQGVLKFTFTPRPPSSSKRHRHGHGGSRSRHRRRRLRRGVDEGGGGGGGGGDGGGGERRRLRLDMVFSRPHRWVFNLGDSIANNGFSGDGAIQENDCEAQGYGKTFAVFASDRYPNGRQKLVKLHNDFIYENLTLIISDQYIEWDNHRGDHDHLNEGYLFALSGQSDRQGPVNYDVYLGLNRVIAGTYRRGHGLCRLSARWLKD